MDPRPSTTTSKLLTTGDSVPFWRKQDLIELPFVLPLLYRSDRKYLDRWPGGERYSPGLDKVAKELRLGRSCLFSVDAQGAQRERPRARILMGHYEIHATVSLNRDNAPRLWLAGVYFASNQRRATYCARAQRASIRGIDVVEGMDFNRLYESADGFFRHGYYVKTLTQHAVTVDLRDEPATDSSTDGAVEPDDDAETTGEGRVLHTLQAFVDAEYELEQLAARAQGTYAYTQFRPEARKSILRRFYRVRLVESDYQRLLQVKPTMLSVPTPDGDDLALEVSAFQPDKNAPEIVVSTNRQLAVEQMPATGELQPMALPTLRNVRTDVITKQRERNTINSWLVAVTAGRDVLRSFQVDSDSQRSLDKSQLNDSQRRAVLAGIATPDIALVLGPPGTGKTTVISNWVEHFVSRGMRVLVASQNNKAVDNVLERLARIKDLVLVRVGNEDKVSSTIHGLLIDNAATDLQQRLTARLGENRRKLSELMQSLAELVLTADASRDFDLVATSYRYRMLCEVLAQYEELRPLCSDEFTPAAALLVNLQRLQGDVVELEGQIDAMRSRAWWVRLFFFLSTAKKRSRLAGMKERLAKDGVQVNEQFRGASAAASEKLNALSHQMERWTEAVSRQNQEAMYGMLLSTVNVVGATCIGINTQRLFRDTHFDVAIIDESGQIQLHNLIVPLSRAPKAILVGDHKQLPPVVADELSREVQNRLGEDADAQSLLKKSWFEWLWDRLPDDRKHRLEVQFRSPQVISDFISEAFYEEQYFAGPGMDRKTALLSCFRSPLVVIDTSAVAIRGEELRKGDTRDEVVGNRFESSLVMMVLQRALAERPDLFGAEEDEGSCEVAVIAPYRHHVNELQSYLANAIRARKIPDPGIPLGEVVATVDSFQGQERDLIIMVFTRSNERGDIGFLADWRRLNVAMTRTKRQLVMIGDFSTLARAARPGRRDADFKEAMRLLIRYVDRHGQRIDARNLEQVLHG